MGSHLQVTVPLAPRSPPRLHKACGWTRAQGLCMLTSSMFLDSCQVNAKSAWRYTEILGGIGMAARLKCFSCLLPSGCCPPRRDPELKLSLFGHPCTKGQGSTHLDRLSQKSKLVSSGHVYYSCCAVALPYEAFSLAYSERTKALAMGLRASLARVRATLDYQLLLKRTTHLRSPRLWIL